MITVTTSSSVIPASSEVELYASTYRLAFEAANAYDGSENSFNSLLTHLIVLDQCLCRMTSRPENTHVPEEEEICLGSRIIKDKVLSISQMLDLAQHSFILGISVEASPKEIAKLLNIYYCEEEGQFAPPDTLSNTPGTESGLPVRQASWVPRIQSLLFELQSQGVFTDDVIMKFAPSTGSKWRYPGYALIEIPRLNYIQIFVSNQVGEGTRVSQNPLHVDTYKTSSKGELDRISGVATIVCNNLPQWTAKIQEFIGKGQIKIPVHLVEQTRREVSKQYELGAFMQLSVTELEYIAVGDSILGVVAPQLLPDKTAQELGAMRLRLAQVIYGVENVEAYLNDVARETIEPVNYRTYDGRWEKLLKNYCHTAEEFQASCEGTFSRFSRAQLTRLLYECGFPLLALNNERLRSSIAGTTYGTVNSWHKLPVHASIEDFKGEIREFEDDLLDGLASPRRLHALAVDFTVASQFLSVLEQRVDQFLEVKKIDLETTFSINPDELSDLYEAEELATLLMEGILKYDSELPPKEFLKLCACSKMFAEHWRNLSKQVDDSLQQAISTFLSFREDASPVTIENCVAIDPAWNLDLSETKMFKILIHERVSESSVDILTLAHFFGEHTESYDHALRGPVAKIARSLKEKLFFASPYELVETNQGFRLASKISASYKEAGNSSPLKPDVSSMNRGTDFEFTSLFDLMWEYRYPEIQDSDLEED